MGKKARKYKYKCNKCMVRNSFIHKLEWYIHGKKCRNCGHTKFHVDRYEMRKGRIPPCTCFGCHYPHRKGSSVCFDNPYYGIDRCRVCGGGTAVDGGANKACVAALKLLFCRL